jgi:hypothetical protein
MEIDQQSVVTAAQGWDPNLQLEASTLSTLQGKYDQNHQKLSNLYGSLLNSAMSRTENIEARNDFFKIINNDIQKMGNIDLSLATNQTAATTVFQSIYKNKNIVKDMTWTRNFQDQLSRAESFKNCTDVAKCGGQYWEEGEKYLHYKRQEFMNAGRDEAMAFQDPKYVPYNNMMEKAIEQANKAGLSIKTDHISGGYKITNKNGDLLATPLTELFTQLFEDNPQFHDMYKVQAYNGRKDWIANSMATGKYKDEGEAMVGYVQQTSETLNRQIANLTTDIDDDAAKLTERYQELYEKYQRGEIKDGSPEYVRLTELDKQAGQISKAKEYSDMLKATQKNMNNTQNIRAIGEMLDDQQAGVLFHTDVTQAGKTLSHKDEEHLMEADKFALQANEFAHDFKLEQMKHANEKDLVTWKAENGAYGAEGGKTNKMLNTLSLFQQANGTVTEATPNARLMTALTESSEFTDALANELKGAKTWHQVKAWIDGLENTKMRTLANTKYKLFVSEYNDAKQLSNKKAADAFTAGNGITTDDFYWDVLKPEDIVAMGSNNPELEEMLYTEYMKRTPTK